jgi:tRNA pseudouridine13 synthase
MPDSTPRPTFLNRTTPPHWAAHGPALGNGRIRQAPEDFVVREHLGFEPTGEGEHWLLTVRKRGANTLWVARQLARFAGVPERDVGFAGLKDRHALTEQAFTVPAKSRTAADWLALVGEGYEVLAAVRHRRKLGRGAHRANDFRIVVRELACDAAALAERMERIRSAGVPNYFGPQRFGNDHGNLALAEQWFEQGVAPTDRAPRSFALSAARAAIFNAVLAARVQDGTWDRLRAGDIANLDGTGSIFAAPEIDATLIQRCAERDVHPTGPLWGRGELATSGEVRELETRLVAPYGSWLTGLAAAGLEQERRALRISVRDLQYTQAHDQLVLEFRLMRGAYATAVLQEILSAGEMSGMEEEG